MDRKDEVPGPSGAAKNAGATSAAAETAAFFASVFGSSSETNSEIPTEIYSYDEIIEKINQTRIDIEHRFPANPKGENGAEGGIEYEDITDDSDSDESISESNYQLLKERLGLIKDWTELVKKDPEDPSFVLTGLDDFIFPLAPPKFESTNEFVWLSPSHEVFPEEGEPKQNENETHEGEIARAAEVTQIALKSALRIGNRDFLLKILETGTPETVFQLNLQPEDFPSLVEQNPLIAIEVLRKLAQNGKDDISGYLDCLLNMTMSVHSMEVVNGLITGAVLMPKQFMYAYIPKCIKTCEEVKDKDGQTRLVRLFCIFMISLIRTQMVDLKNLYVEILKFCVDFSRIRESAALFRIVRKIESEDPRLKF